MQGEILAVQYAKGVDYSSVRHEDKSEVERIIVGLVTFEKTMPALDIDIHDAGDHYNISAKGYVHQIDLDRFYNKFRGENSDYDFIQGISFTPAPSCIVKINVKKRDFSDSRRRGSLKIPATPRKESRGRSKHSRRSRRK